MAAWSKSSRRRTSTSARSASRAAATSVNALRVGEKVGAGELRHDTHPLGLLVGMGVGVPPGAVRRDRQRAQARLELGGDVGWSGHPRKSMDASRFRGGGTRAPRSRARRRRPDAQRDDGDARPCRLAGDRRALRALSLLAIRLAVEGSTGGHRPDAEGALQLVAEQPLSQGLLVLLMLGLKLHAVWRLAQAVGDREHAGDGAKGS